MEINNYAENNGVMANTINGNVTVISKDNIKKIPALLPKFIEKLVSLVDDEDESIRETIDKEEYDVEDKIYYNDLNKYKDLVDDYGEYHYICNSALKSVNEICRTGEKKILRNVSEMYKDEKRKVLLNYEQNYTSRIEAIRANSDYIIDTIKKRLTEMMEESYANEEIYEEDLEFSASIFVCYCFVKCKILEKPPKGCCAQ